MQGKKGILPTTIRTYQLEALRRAVLARFGRDTLFFPDTPALSEEIFASTGFTISTTTLQRFFGLVVSKSVPYRATLDILSDYAGFQNWDGFCQHRKEAPQLSAAGYLPDESGIILLDICLNNRHFGSVMDYIDQLPSKYPLNQFSDARKAQVRISNALGRYLRRDPEGRNTLLPLLAQNKRGREYFFETFVDMDYCDEYYADALELYRRYASHCKTPEGRSEYMFATAIQLQNQLEKGDLKAMLPGANRFFQAIKPQEATPDYCHHIPPLARYHALRLVFDSKTGGTTTLRRERFLQNQQDLIELGSVVDITLVQTLQALHYAEAYEELIEFYEYNLNWFRQEPWHDETTPLVHAYAFHAFKLLGREFPFSPINVFSPREKSGNATDCSVRYVERKINSLVS